MISSTLMSLVLTATSPASAQDLDLLEVHPDAMQAVCALAGKGYSPSTNECDPYEFDLSEADQETGDEICNRLGLEFDASEKKCKLYTFVKTRSQDKEPTVERPGTLLPLPDLGSWGMVVDADTLVAVEPDAVAEVIAIIEESEEPAAELEALGLDLIEQ